ncbi:GAF and ANTAR domain-containing protein [Nocardioides sp.]|uniref:GAF and ANTAR domain-containing protein n=1 Tax=Nocardioides sp. TaxID=35761 RepID=UPI00260FBE0F|nr:GAF and ANTAR domain-containing protein [Nocardioides sp.]MCW2739430.1 hypothetical protein [Nocardioides sp.]
MTSIAADQLARVLVEVADTLIDEFDLIDFLQRVTTHASDLVGAGICGLMLADHRRRLQLMASSDERVEMLELFQVQTQEGPCQDCFHTGRPVAVANLRDAEDRWPHFAPLALEAGFNAIHAFPMRLRGQAIGALNMFAVDAGPMQESDVRVVQALADIATIALLQERAVTRAEVLSEQLQSALNSRIVIEQAKGYLAQVHGESPDEAFARMRTYCRRHGLRLGQVASGVTTEPDTLPELTRPPAG